MTTHPYRHQLSQPGVMADQTSGGAVDYLIPGHTEIQPQNDINLTHPRPQDLSSPRFAGDRLLTLGSFNNTVKSTALPDSLYYSENSSVPGFALDAPQPIGVYSSISHSEPDFQAPTNSAMLAHKLLMSSCLSFLKYDSFPAHLMDQSLVKQHLGNNSTNLKSRLETSEQYRKNAKRSNDPKVLFHYAQFMLQMALELKELEPKQQETKRPKFHSRSLSDSSNSSRRQPSLSLSNFTDNQIQMTMFLKEAQQYLKRLSDKGYVEAQYLLGDAWSSGAFGKVDDERAFGLFLLSAKHGHTESAFRVAHCYEEGLGTGRDARKCIELLKKAASEKHPAAMYKLGVYHFYAKMGIADNMTNKKMAINWLERASSVATELTAAAPYELGKIYYEGYKDIVIRDREYAVRLFTKAAALNHVAAAAKLGEHYEEGVDGLPSEHLSINYYTQAALLGHPGAMLALGAWYLCGAESLELNEEEALLWIKKSAECGYAKAQYTYGHFLELGKGCEPDPKLAQEMFIRSAEGGYENALKRIEGKSVAAKLSKRFKKSSRVVTTKNDPEAKCTLM